jgi:hypothetical protein
LLHHIVYLSSVFPSRLSLFLPLKETKERDTKVIKKKHRGLCLGTRISWGLEGLGRWNSSNPKYFFGLDAV